ncbi:MAG: helix-turn-helix domain-containing protein [Tannerellaceae bacterium]|jgi:ligand-binding sensor domain-containing protein/AraC-like DNA-binding protein/CheY-like chemotaxis protein/nitrogen-specific signal transduction histidine kinase|nr:helix-turn-helix domain-containing protein [Tannerellaceae bacterium]
MQTGHKILVLQLTLLFSILTVYGKAGEMYFRHYTNKHGLSHNTVYCSLQDRNGFMWFGTEDGLNRFDGYNFKVYRHNSYQPDNSLADDRIVSLFEDSEGTLWVCTGYSTCYYDEKTDSFYPFNLSPDSNMPEYFSAIDEDSRHNLWMISAGRILRYSLDNKVFQLYPAESYFYPVALVMNAQGEPIFSSHHDLYVYRSGADTFTCITILTETEKQEQTLISAICEVPEAGILIGTDKKGLKFYSYYTRQVETIIPDIQVRDITAYSPTIYWIASESGVYICDLLNRQTEQLTKSLTNEYTISDNAVYSITKDKEGGVWVGTFFGGVNYLPQEYVSFNRFIGGKTHPQMLGNAVREICPDNYGNLWIGTEDNGINRYHPQTGIITNYSLNNPLHPLSATNIHGLFADGDKLWIGTFNKGIDVLELPSGKLIKRYTQANTNNELISDFVLCFHKLKDGNLLIGTSNGIVYYDRQTDRFRKWENVSGVVRQIYTDTKDNIWIVTTLGLYRYLSDRYHSQSLGSNNITSVFEDSDRRIWVTTVNGFSLHNEDTDTFNHITVEDGLPSNITYRILEDNEHNFWITTANGLVKFNPDTYEMRTFSYTDGLHETQFNYSSSYKAADGTMFMGTINGMIAFNPEQFKTDSYIPPVRITTIHIPGHTGSSFTESKEELLLSHDKAAFTLSYVALSYTSPGAIQYAYKLEGVDADWNYMRHNKDVTFANLSPGNYIFKVKSTNSSGLWQDNEASLPITITPPFWATVWAFILYGVLLICFVILFYNYKKKKLETKHQMQKEKELYDAKIQFFTFITHEIRTPLTLIRAPLEKILALNEGSPVIQKNLRIIEKNTLQLLDLSNQLLDFRKTENKGFKLTFVRTDVTFWLEIIIQRFIPSFEKENKMVTIQIPKQPLFADIDREALSKIMNNMITNALKYSQREVTIELSPLKESDETVTISVTNDGTLIPEGEEEKIFLPFYRVKETEHIQGSGIGLSLARALTENHHGRLSYQRIEGLNRFTLTFPVKQGESPRLIDNINKPYLLIVEDQADMRRFIADELSTTYQILEAENGKVALNILNNYMVKIIVSDVMMPVMDGFELCNEVKNNINYSHIPFILLTAQHNLQSHLKGLNNGADAYMEKPFSMELLISQIQNLVKSRELLSRIYLEKPLSSTVSLAVSKIDELFLEKFTTYLEENLTNEALNIDLIAEEMHMSASGLYRKVKGLSGLSPVDFIRIVRLKKAVRLMQEGERRISDIAFKVGFSSPAYFSTCFQKQYGKTPSEYMKEILSV